MKITYKVTGTSAFRYTVHRYAECGTNRMYLGTYSTLWSAKRAIRKDIRNETRHALAQKEFAGKVFHEEELSL